MWVSMVLTSTPHRRCMPERNRRIPTIPAGRADAGPIDVSAVDTGQGRRESVVRTAEPGTLTLGPAALLPAWSSLAPAQGPGGHGSTPAPPRVGSRRPAPRGSGSTGQGLYVLHESPTYVEYPRPSSSSTPPSCSASRRRIPTTPEATTLTGPAPPPGRSSSSPIWQTHPTDVSDVMTSETLRSHETT